MTLTTKLILLAAIVAIILVIFVIARLKKHTGKNPNELANPSKPSVMKSKFFPEKIYEGKSLRLDSTLRLTKGLMFEFPHHPLIVSDFRYFDVDTTSFEEIAVDRLTNTTYVLLYDSYEKLFYVLSLLMTVGTPDPEIPAMVSQETLTLTTDRDYVFSDFSGLIEVSVKKHDGSSANKRLIRVYARDVDDAKEFLVCVMDVPGVVKYFVGLQISPLQLED
jgi:hypothetical protein